MNRIAIIYWTNTGNTEVMANFIKDSCEQENNHAKLFHVNNFNPLTVNNYDVLALGCPAMGTEQIEEQEFAPMIAKIEDKLVNKGVILFGSYGWGKGKYLEALKKRLLAKKAIIITENIISNEYPNKFVEKQCFEAGKILVNYHAQMALKTNQKENHHE